MPNTAAHILTAAHPTKSSDFNYPVTAYYLELNGSNGIAKHLIFSFADAGTDYANAPNGSVLIQYTDGGVFVKYGTDGLIDGTWVEAT